MQDQQHGDALRGPGLAQQGVALVDQGVVGRLPGKVAQPLGIAAEVLRTGRVLFSQGGSAPLDPPYYEIKCKQYNSIMVSWYHGIVV